MIRFPGKRSICFSRRSTPTDPQLIRDCHVELTKLVADGQIRPLIGERLGLTEVADGIQRLADGSTVGRLVFVP